MAGNRATPLIWPMRLTYACRFLPRKFCPEWPAQKPYQWLLTTKVRGYMEDNSVAVEVKAFRECAACCVRMHSHGLREDHCRFYFQQIILALDYCHKMSISNRDIKLENTLLDSTRSNRNPLIKLCDFGYSINESHSLPKTAVGTPGYTGD